MYEELFRYSPTPCVVARLSGEVVTANLAAVDRLGIDPDGPPPQVADFFDGSASLFQQSLAMAGGSGVWQHSVARLKTGDLRGLAQQLRWRGLRPSGTEEPLVMIQLRDGNSSAFREHTRLIARLNTELARQRGLRDRMDVMIRREQYLHRELVHRIKNNLTVLSGIIRASIRRQTSPEARQALAEVDVRAQSIALVHELLDRDNEIEIIEAHDLIVNLCELMRRSLMPASVTLSCKVESLRLHNSDATALCLLINELVTNALKHAFGPDPKGAIELDFRQNGVDKMELRVRDDGRGFSGPAVPEGANESHGTQIIYALARQLNGELTHEQKDGTQWTLVFNPRESETLAAE